MSRQWIAHTDKCGDLRICLYDNGQLVVCPSIAGTAAYDYPLRSRSLADDDYASADQPQWIVTEPVDDVEWLVSFWGGLGESPEVAPRIDGTRWGVPLHLTAVA